MGQQFCFVYGTCTLCSVQVANQCDCVLPSLPFDLLDPSSRSVLLEWNLSFSLSSDFSWFIMFILALHLLVKITKNWLIIKRYILMPVHETPLVPELLHIKKQSLDHSTNIEESLISIKEIGTFLSTLDLSSISKLDILLFDYLKPISREITNTNVSYAEAKPILQNSLLAIVKIYAKCIRFYYSINAFEIINELLQRHTEIFKKGHRSVTIDGGEIMEEEFKQNSFDSPLKSQWVKISSYSSETPFFYLVCHEIIQNINGVEKQFHSSGLNFVKEYLHFLYFFDDYLKRDKIILLCEKIVETLEEIFSQPHNELYKDVIKQVSYQMCSDLKDAGLKVLKLTGQIELKKRYEMLGPVYGMGLLKNFNSIEKKLQGLKVISKWAHFFFANPVAYVKETVYIQWAVDNKIPDLIYEDPTQTPIIKTSGDFIKLFLRVKCLGQENFIRLLEFADSAIPQVKQLIYKYADLASSRFEYKDYEIILNKFEKVHSKSTYEQEQFSLIETIGKYATYNQNKRIQKSLQAILQQTEEKFRNYLIENKCIDLYVAIFNKVIDRSNDITKRTDDLYEFVNPYIEKFSPFGVVLMKKAIGKLPDIGSFSRNKASYFLIKEKNVLELGLIWLDLAQPKDDVEEFLCYILQCAKEYYYQKFDPSAQLFIQATKNAKVFEKMLPFIDDLSKLTKLYEEFVTIYLSKRMPFICLRLLFFRMNRLYTNEILDAADQYELRTTAPRLRGFEHLKDLLLNAKYTETRGEIAEFMSYLFTIYSDENIEEGERELKEVMQNLILETLDEFNKMESEDKLMSYLYLIEYFMQATQLFGVGEWKSHNSLVATSTVTVKIINDVTYGNDVLKVFEKKMPSNLSLFELIEEISNHFKCPSSEVMFREGLSMWPERWNGLTLEEVKIDGRSLSAVKSFRNKIRKEALLTAEQELTEKARKVFEQMYNMFAVDGKMGKKQCAAYVSGVTKTTCTTWDSRVTDFFRDFDSDKDDNLTLEDFLRFYKSSSSPFRDDIVWKNLATLRYRKDLKKYDDPIQKPADQLVFRSYLSKNHEIYKMLFNLSESKNLLLKQKAICLLFRLPTFPLTQQSFFTDLQLQKKNSFQTEYLLIALQSYLSQEDDRVEKCRKFIDSGNSTKIFEMMTRIAQMENPTEDEKKCLYISLKILRSLILIPNLREEINQNYEYIEMLSLPEAELILQICKKSLYNLDLEIFQSSLCLQFTQKNLNLDFFLQYIFHQEYEIRKISCNFIFIAYKMKRVQINIFNIQPEKNCEYWFRILLKIVRTNEDLHFNEMLNHCLHELEDSYEDISLNPDDSIIFGNLSLLQALLTKHSNQQRPKPFIEQLISLSKRLISGRNRKMIYNLLSIESAEFALEYVGNLVNSIEPVKEVSVKRFFVGIKNLGSICYMNSVLQQFYFVPQFKELVFSLICEKVENTEVDGKLIIDNILYQLQKMYTYLDLSQRGHYSPDQFCLTIKDFNNKPVNIRIQEDAHEFVGGFLDRLEPYLKKNEKMENLQKIFGGKTLTQLSCEGCSNKIHRQQNFIQLSLEVKNIKQLRDSFKKFNEPESINDYFCEGCGKKVEKITKQVFLSELPKVLIINLQRIIFDLQTFLKVKVDTTFSFPHEINLYDYVQSDNIHHEQCQYELQGIVIHSGTSQSGHYYSIIKQNSEWFKFNDQTVSKFDPKDIPREAFGGSDTTDQWNDELKFSTNAYILFYTKKQKQEEMIISQLNSPFKKQVQEDNSVLYKQIQVHQESLFQFANQSYEKIRPNDIEEVMKLHPFDENWEKNPNYQSYENTFKLMLELLKFAKVFYDVKSDHIFKLGNYLYELFYLLPERSYTFLMEIDPKECLNYLCLHNDDTIRNVYRCLLNKTLHTYVHYYGLNLENEDTDTLKYKELLDVLFDYFTDEKLLTNIYKSNQFFDFWKNNCELVPQILAYATKRQILVKLGDMLMDNDSPFAEKGKKRPEVPQYQAIPIIQMISFLMSRKKNLVNYINPINMNEDLTYEQMTQNEKKIYGNISLYRKLIRRRADGNGLMATVTSKLSEKDEDFSKKMVEVFLKGLNSSYDEIQSSLILINHLKFYLLIDDELTESRIKWVMGIPQLEMGEDMNYGLKYYDESSAYSYVSPLFFIQSDQYQPGLHVLFLKRSIYTQFSLAGVNLLLDLLCNSDKFFNYLMSIPAPTYFLRFYADWIEEYINKLKEEDSYYFQFDKNVAYNQLYAMYKIFEQKMADSKLDFPVNKYIIGKNKNLDIKTSIGNADYEMALWEHTTYVLENKPNGFFNESLPKDLFKFSQPQDYAVNFVTTSKKMVENDEFLATKLALYTLQVNTKIPLKLVFKLQKFKEEIYIQKGQIHITIPHEPLEPPLTNYLHIIEGEKKEDMIKQPEPIHQFIDANFPSIMDDNHVTDATKYGQKECSACTYINFGRERCELCDNLL